MPTVATAATEYTVLRDRVSRYFFLSQLVFMGLVGGWMFGIGLVVAVIYAFTLGPWMTQRQAAALRYWLDGSTLRIDQGVWFLKRKAIPLDRITDVVLSQGPLLRLCGIWTLGIQTAGAGAQALPEGILYGIEDPEAVRDQLIEARDAAVRAAAGAA